MISNPRFVEDCAQIRPDPELLRPSLEHHELQRTLLGPDAPPMPVADLTVTWPDRSLTNLRVPLTQTTQYRGVRWWFLCPTCKRRCSCLYSPSPSVHFACRKCRGLVYRSQHETRLVRTLRRTLRECRLI